MNPHRTPADVETDPPEPHWVTTNYMGIIALSIALSAVVCSITATVMWVTSWPEETTLCTDEVYLIDKHDDHATCHADATATIAVVQESGPVAYVLCECEKAEPPSTDKGDDPTAASR